MSMLLLLLPLFAAIARAILPVLRTTPFCILTCAILEASSLIKSKNLKPYNFLKDGTEQPMVFAWIPAISIYFDDPDGHSLEFLGKLQGKSKPEKEKLVVSYDDWLAIKANEEYEKLDNISRKKVQVHSHNEHYN